MKITRGSIMRGLAAECGDCRGQAMVETMLVTVCLAIVLFAAIQVSIVVVNDMISNEAAFALNRVAVVSPERERERNLNLAAVFLLARQTAKRNFIPLRHPVEFKSLKGIHRADEAASSNVTLHYASSIMFASWLRGSKTHMVEHTRLLKNAARSRMIRSPGEEYYYRAYPGAESFSE